MTIVLGASLIDDIKDAVKRGWSVTFRPAWAWERDDDGSAPDYAQATRPITRTDGGQAIYMKTLSLDDDFNIATLTNEVDYQKAIMQRSPQYDPQDMEREYKD